MGCTASKSTDAAENNRNRAPDVVFDENDQNASIKGENVVELEGSVYENRIDDPITPNTSSRRSSQSKQLKNNDITVTQMTDFVDPYHNESSKVFKGVYANQTVLCKDEFFSKYTDQKMYRWRKAEIIAIEGEDRSRVLIHYVGWADSFDQWLDLHYEWFKLAPVGLLSKAECDKGVELSDVQQSVVTEFLLEGEQHLGYLKEEGSSSSRPISGKGSRSSSISGIIKYTAGQMVEVQDIYQKRGSANLYYQWRKAQITNISGTHISIHYMERDSRYDEVLDMQTQYRRIRDLGNASEHGDLDGNRSMSKNSTHYFTSEETLSERDDLSRLQSAAGRSGKGRRRSIQSQSQQEQEEEGEYFPAAATQSSRTPRQRRHGQSLATATATVASPSAVYVNIPLASEIVKSEQLFSERLQKRGLHIVQIEGDGNCLFRAVSHQLFLNENRHDELRAKCVKHMIKHRKRFEMFCDQNFDEHVQEMQKLGTWGDDLEIRALEEIIDRIICIYGSNMDSVDEPTNKNFEEDMLLQNVSPVNLTYHGQSHFNSLCDERNPPPLHMRDSSILLLSRVALFEDFLQSASTKVSAEVNLTSSFSASNKHVEQATILSHSDNTCTTEESLFTEVASTNVPRKVGKHNSKTATTTTYT